MNDHLLGKLTFDKFNELYLSQQRVRINIITTSGKIEAFKNKVIRLYLNKTIAS